MTNLIIPVKTKFQQENKNQNFGIIYKIKENRTRIFFKEENSVN
jgi:hypothetical protein